VRRQIDPSLGKDPELAFYRSAEPTQQTGTGADPGARGRWGIEACFQTAKNEAGLDQYQVWTWRALVHPHRLAILAAYLTATHANEIRRLSPPVATLALAPLVWTSSGL